MEPTCSIEACKLLPQSLTFEIRPILIQELTAISNSHFDPVQSTYYGNWDGAGACSLQFTTPNSFTLPWRPANTFGVAMNSPQWGNSAPCGMCIAMIGTGPGAGANPVPTTFYQYTMGEALVTGYCALSFASRSMSDLTSRFGRAQLQSIHHDVTCLPPRKCGSGIQQCASQYIGT